MGPGLDAAKDLGKWASTHSECWERHEHSRLGSGNTVSVTWESNLRCHVWGAGNQVLWHK